MSSVGKRAWQVYRVVIALIALACVAQFYLAGRGVFGGHTGVSLADETSFDPHRMLGGVIGIAALAAFVLALVLWDMQLVVWTLILAVLSEAVQNVTTRSGEPWIAAFHAVSGLAILGISAWLAHRAWRHRGVAEQAA
jgi:uncharacterized membrane protein YqgA involved in biofilm formation